MKSSTCIYLTRTYERFYSTKPTLKSLLQTRNEQYITKLPSLKKTTTAFTPHEIRTELPTLPHLNDIHTLRLLSGEDDTHSIALCDPRFSILLNKCLNNAPDNVKLRTIQSIESFYNIFKRYQAEFTNINGVIYYDFNKLCQYFIDRKQLAKGQIVLEFLFKSNAPKNDIFFLRNYLNLRCGSDIRLWNHKKYRIFDYMTISQLSHEFGKVGYLDEELIHSFGYMKNMSSLKQYIEEVWGVTLEPTISSSMDTDKSVKLTKNNLLYPTNNLLLSIMSSYYYNDGNISRAFIILDLFLKKYPDIKLDHKFWYGFLKTCITLIPDDSNNHSNFTQVWNAMKLWYGVNPIPFNNEVLTMAYPILKENNNLFYANDIYIHCIGPYITNNPNLSLEEYKIVIMYQKYIIRKHIDKRHAGLAHDFIDKWSISLKNKEDLLQLYSTRINTRKKKPVSQQGYDDSDEDDGMFTPLW